jgi:hypothetical protein
MDEFSLSFQAKTYESLAHLNLPSAVISIVHGSCGTLLGLLQVVVWETGTKESFAYMYGVHLLSTKPRGGLFALTLPVEVKAKQSSGNHTMSTLENIQAPLWYSSDK